MQRQTVIITHTIRARHIIVVTTQVTCLVRMEMRSISLIRQSARLWSAHIYLFIFPINAKPETDLSTHTHTRTPGQALAFIWNTMMMHATAIEIAKKKKLPAHSLVRAPGGKCNILKFWYYFRWVGGCWICGTKTMWICVSVCHSRHRHRHILTACVFSFRSMLLLLIRPFPFLRFLIRRWVKWMADGGWRNVSSNWEQTNSVGETFAICKHIVA